MQVLARDIDFTGFKAQVFLYPTMSAVPFTMFHYIPTSIATGELDSALANRMALRFVDNCKKAGYDYAYFSHPRVFMALTTTRRMERPRRFWGQHWNFSIPD